MIMELFSILVSVMVVFFSFRFQITVWNPKLKSEVWLTLNNTDQQTFNATVWGLSSNKKMMLGSKYLM